MNFSILFFFNSILLGVGLAMDAFSVSLANGMNDKDMKKIKMAKVAGIYAFFQFLMPMVGWICVHTIVEYFTKFQSFIPWIALILLLYIGINMIIEALKGDEESEAKELTLSVLIIQGIATSIDALSVGFTISDYDLLMAFIAALIIAIVTFAICSLGLTLGKKFGTRFSDKAGLLGGTILILIGLEIFIKGVFF